MGSKWLRRCRVKQCSSRNKVLTGEVSVSAGSIDVVKHRWVVSSATEQAGGPQAEVQQLIGIAGAAQRMVAGACQLTRGRVAGGR